MFETIFQEGLEADGLRSAAVSKIRDFCSMIQKYSLMVPNTSAFEIAEGILRESGLAAAYDKESTLTEKNDRAQNLDEVLNAIAQRQQSIIDEMVSAAEDGVNIEVPSEVLSGEKPVLLLPGYLEDVLLLSSIDEKEEESGSNKVTVMTMHMAKGLEYMHVYVCGMEENIFPSGGWTMTEKDLEEERRLCYVAMTRAKKTLTLSFASKRFRNGKDEYNSPSRFLREIAPQYLDKPLTRQRLDEISFSSERQSFSGGASRWAKPQERSVQKPVLSQPAKPILQPKARQTAQQDNRPPVIDANFVPAPMSSFHIGDRIEHNRFGAGEILTITGEIPDLKAKVRFDKYGEKILILKFAKLRHI